jgi:hypothetical protein
MEQLCRADRFLRRSTRGALAPSHVRHLASLSSFWDSRAPSLLSYSPFSLALPLLLQAATASAMAGPAEVPASAWLRCSNASPSEPTTPLYPPHLTAPPAPLL